MISVTKSNGSVQPFDRVKLQKRIEHMVFGLNTKYVDVAAIVETVSQGVVDKIATTKIDELVAQTAAYSVTKHPDYGLLGGRLAVSALHKNTSGDIKTVITKLHEHVCVWNKKPSPLVADFVREVVETHHEALQKIIDFKYDFNYEFFGYKTLERSYLLRAEVPQKDGKQSKLVIIERPQMMLMRVSIGIHRDNLEKVKETYELLAQGIFTHATPTLFNAGTPKPQMSSCFLVAMKEDSIEGIYDTLKECASISKSAGGIGVHVHNIRATGSYIGGTNGQSNGLVPMLRVFNNTARYVDQGGGKRKGAFAVYLEPWHADIGDFLQLKKNTGKDENRARDLFYGLWIPDLFMKRVEESAKWTLFDPATAPGLADCHGDAFEKLYTQYEEEGRGLKTVNAHELWFTILESQMETGTPYMLYKDAANMKSNQQNLGTIKCSNLCTEIIEYTSPEETAVCNLASIALPRFVDQETKKFDFDKLRSVTKVITRNLNRVIDENYYPVKTAENSNKKHRPIGLGIQGLADTFIMMRQPFASEESKTLNEDIFETIYFAACEASCELAEKDGHYQSYPGSPASEGRLSFDLWNQKPKSGRWDWDALKVQIKKHGLRNSLMVAPMPTASTSQILGNNECFEPFTSNIYVRRVLSGEFPVVNKYLVVDLIQRGLWNEDVRNLIIAHNGSVQRIDEIPREVRDLYKTVWEIRQKDVIDMAAHRGKYIDQSQSLNLFLESPKSSQLTSMHFYAWKQGLKTGMYYLRSRPAVEAIKFTVDQAKVKAAEATMKQADADENQAPGGKQIANTSVVEECLSCGA